MKKVFLLLTAAFVALSASAQNDKLNFEAPLFGVTKKNVKPKWSVVALPERGIADPVFRLVRRIGPGGFPPPSLAQRPCFLVGPFTFF